MEEYPEEYRTPPVSLISLVGCADHQALISKHLLGEQPPINTLALPDLAKFLVLLAHKDSTRPPNQASGILRRDWLIKHRTRIPSVVAALFTSRQLSGDPTQWLQVCSDLDNLKAVLRPRNIKFVVIVIVQSSSNDDINEDRFIALRKRADIDSKYILTFNPNDATQLNQSLTRHPLYFSFSCYIGIRDLCLVVIEFEVDYCF